MPRTILTVSRCPVTNNPNIAIYVCTAATVPEQWMGWRDRSLPASKMLLLRFLASVFFANHGECANLHNAAEHACSYLRTAWIITEIFTQDLFMAVRGLNARLDGYKRNGKSLQASCLIFVNPFC